jgi:glycosyltransferase involved in cell wall biosynthesis
VLLLKLKDKLLVKSGKLDISALFGMTKSLRKDRVKIAVDLTPMLPGGQNGGVKPAILEFLTGMQRLAKPKLDFLFLTAESTHDEIQAITTEHDEVLCMNVERAREVQCPSFFRQRRIDLLYAPFGMIAYPNCGVPIVAMVVDVLHRDYLLSIDEKEREWREGYFRQMVTCADRFQVISDYTGESLMRHYGVAAERVFRTYLPIQERLKIAHTNLPDAERFFFYPANFWPHKNHEVLLIAYQIYRSQAGPEAWKLVLTGSDDPRKKMLQELAAVLGIESHTIFKGYVPEAELAVLFSSASALVFPSLHEGFGIPPVEAMKLGVPVLTSDSGSLREVVGEAALKVDPRKPFDLASAMYRIATSEPLRANLRRRGFERAREFSLDAEVVRLAQVFQDLVRSAKKSSLRHRLSLRLESMRNDGSAQPAPLGTRLYRFIRDHI